MSRPGNYTEHTCPGWKPQPLNQCSCSPLSSVCVCICNSKVWRSGGLVGEVAQVNPHHTHTRDSSAAAVCRANQCKTLKPCACFHDTGVSHAALMTGNACGRTVETSPTSEPGQISHRGSLFFFQLCFFPPPFHLRLRKYQSAFQLEVVDGAYLFSICHCVSLFFFSRAYQTVEEFLQAICLRNRWWPSSLRAQFLLLLNVIMSTQTS